jgi:hypothetical protein
MHLMNDRRGHLCLGADEPIRHQDRLALSLLPERAEGLQHPGAALPSRSAPSKRSRAASHRSISLTPAYGRELSSLGIEEFVNKKLVRTTSIDAPLSSPGHS